MAKKLKASCHCGAVTVILSRVPEYINQCNCSLCCKSGGAWGYYSPSDVNIDGETFGYTRKDMEAPVVQVRFCGICGSTTHWQLTDAFTKSAEKSDVMGVNMNLFRREQLVGAELRFPDGEAWTGEGEYSYCKPAFIISERGNGHA